MKSFTFPSKTFILGEYSILESGLALLLGHRPYFHSTVEADKKKSHPFPQGSSAEKIAPDAHISFQDPHMGNGGFGASGAEFLTCWSANKKSPQTEQERIEYAFSAWKESRDFPGSGADILTQAYGMNQINNFLLEIDITDKKLQSIESKIGATISLFQTGRKISTHEHLAEKYSIPKELNSITKEGIGALREGNKKGFSNCIQSYGNALAKLGLLTASSSQALASAPRNILASKGCGAMGSDVLLILHEKVNLQEWARKNSLTLAAEIPV